MSSTLVSPAPAHRPTRPAQGLELGQAQQGADAAALPAIPTARPQQPTPTAVPKLEASASPARLSAPSRQPAISPWLFATHRATRESPQIRGIHLTKPKAARPVYARFSSRHTACINIIFIAPARIKNEHAIIFSPPGEAGGPHPKARPRAFRAEVPRNTPSARSEGATSGSTPSARPCAGRKPSHDRGGG